MGLTNTLRVAFCGITLAMLVGGCTTAPPNFPTVGVGTVDVVSLNLPSSGTAREQSLPWTERKANVYLPPGYDAHPERRYPVIYLLHGFGGNERSNLGRVTGLLDALIAKGTVPPTIVVMPDGGYDYFMGTPYNVYFHMGNFFTDGYAPDSTGAPFPFRWEDYFLHELLPTIEARYRTLADRTHRMLWGQDMGGFGAAYLGIKHRDLFGGFAAHSGLLSFDELPAQIPALYAEIKTGKPGRRSLLFIAMDKAFSPLNSQLMPAVDDSGRVTYDTQVFDYWKQNFDPVQWVATAGASLQNSRIYFDAGDHDVLNLDLHVHDFAHALDAVGATYMSQVYAGRDVDRVYYHMPEALAVLTRDFPR